MPTSKEDLKSLTKLGKGATSKVEKSLEVFPNHAGPNMEVELVCTEFTCRCPLTGQPDYAEIVISYVPNKYVVESKSMKLYLETYRNEGVFHEHLAVDIGKDFVKFVKPKKCEVEVMFNIRGGIAISAKWKHGK